MYIATYAIGNAFSGADPEFRMRECTYIAEKLKKGYSIVYKILYLI